MNFFQLLFYFLILFSVIILASVINLAARGRRRNTWIVLRAYLVLVAIYGTVLLATTLALPIRVLPMNEPQYAGDWSIAPTNLRREPHGLDEDYAVDFTLSNHGVKAINGPKRLIVYLVAEGGARYDEAPEPSNPPFDATIQPGKSVLTTRKFVLPTNLNRVELVIARQGFRLGWFIIGRSPFDSHTVVLLQ